MTPGNTPRVPSGLAFNRLSIIDLSGGHQPMSNEDGTVWLVFNGEIYNFAELRKRLEARGHRFRTHSDTETILHAWEEYGERCVDHLRGMFAFAIWDSRPPPAVRRPRPAGHQAVLLLRGLRAVRFRLRDQVAARSARHPARAGPGGGGRVPAPALRGRAAHHVPRHPEAGAGPHRFRHRRRGARCALLGGAAGAGRAGERSRGARARPRAARRVRAHAPGGGRSAGRVPLRRRGFELRGGADVGARGRAHQDVFDRLRQRRQRAGLRAHRGAPLRDRAPRVEADASGVPGGAAAHRVAHGRAGGRPGLHPALLPGRVRAP